MVVTGYKASKKLKEEKLRQNRQKGEETSSAREVVREGRKEGRTAILEVGKSDSH
jgi:hypothetical protein